MYINRLHGIGCMCNEKIGDIQHLQRVAYAMARCMCNEKIGDIQRPMRRPYRGSGVCAMKK